MLLRRFVATAIVIGCGVLVGCSAVDAPVRPETMVGDYVPVAMDIDEYGPITDLEVCRTGEDFVVVMFSQPHIKDYPFDSWAAYYELHIVPYDEVAEVYDAKEEMTYLVTPWSRTQPVVRYRIDGLNPSSKYMLEICGCDVFNNGGPWSNAVYAETLPVSLADLN